MHWLLKISGAAAACLSAACGTLSSSGSNTIDNPFIDAESSAGWASGDLEAHRAAFLTAVEASGEEKTVEWTGENAQGRIAAKEARLVLSSDEPTGKAAPIGLRLAGAMEMNLGVHVITSNANVRLGPSTDDKVVATLKAGTRVEVVGRLVRAPWALIAQNGRVRGYVFEELIMRPAGAASRLAGAMLVTPVYCRSVSQSIEGASGASEQVLLACRNENGWFVLGRQG